MRGWPLFLFRITFRLTPDLREEFVEFRLGFLQFGAIERIEIVDAEKSLGHLREELHWIGKSVVLHALNPTDSGPTNSRPSSRLYRHQTSSRTAQVPSTFWRC